MSSSSAMMDPFLSPDVPTGKYYTVMVLYESDVLKETVIQKMIVINANEVCLIRRNDPLVLMQFPSVRRFVRKSANISRIRFALENGKHKTYFSRVSDIDITTLDVSHILKKKSNKRKHE